MATYCVIVTSSRDVVKMAVLSWYVVLSYGVSSEGEGVLKTGQGAAASAS